MSKKVAIIGSGTTAKTVSKTTQKSVEAIEVLPPLPLFKDLSIGQRFRWKNKDYKKVSAFAAYRNKDGLFSFGANTPVEKINP